MKKSTFATVIVTIFLALGLNAQNSKVLMTLGNHRITTDDFVYLFLKNNTEQVNEQNVENYLNLYKNFKLKVIEAQELGYDTTASFRNEFNSYRNQIAVGYLIDRQMEEKLIAEAYNNLKEDVQMSHIMLRLPQNATPADTLKVYKKALNIIKRLGKEDFAKVALSVSEDSSVKNNKGNVGWFTGQMVMYPLERAMYSLPVGKVSAPIRTAYGYHIIKINNRRPSVGKVQVAHILKKFPEQATKAQKDSIRNEIFAIYAQLKNGVKFEDLAMSKSDDKASAQNGGLMNYFGVGRMVSKFEETAFALKNVGELSEPFETPFGWHIIQLVDKKPVDSFDKLKPEILRAFNNDGRAQACRQAFVDNLKKQYGYKLDNAAFDELVAYAKQHTHPDSLYLAGAKDMKKTLFSIKNHNITQDSYIKYIYSLSNNKEDNTISQTYNLLENFVNEEILRFEDTQLEAKYPDFKYLLQEYHDGILLFNISNDLIWEKASRDTAGLEQYFKNNIKNYKWDSPRYKGRIFYCKDKKVSNDIRKKAKKMTESQLMGYIAELNVDSLMVDTEYGIWVKGDNKVVDCLGFKDKKATFTPTAKYPYVFVIGELLPLYPSSYKDVKAAVITDYQDFLEAEWLKELYKKYPVNIDNDVKKETVQELKNK